MTRDEMYSVKEAILAAEEALTSQMWTAQKRLNGSFKSTHDQLQVAIEVGALATAVEHLRKSRSLLKASPQRASDD
ncbi:MAG: hypothetical protein CMJ25_11470 [Phycisphaerae bacterium]|nr:hypothetical protein [Phycisphaerae bacterium]